MENSKKGTVTSLSSVFPPEEARKASKRVLDTIADHQKELDQLQQFISDNNNVVNLVQQLPEQLHHDIMVPFGKSAFFPGRLIHTNEFLVLLGEGYYVDRTSKQTTEILNRRGKTLESQVESLEAVMQDLKVEASFFDATASEAAEGLVEIREDYIDEASSEKVSPTDNKTVVVEDEEYARLLARMDELEKEELEADNVDGYESDEVDFKDQVSQLSADHRVKNSEMQLSRDSVKASKDVYLTKKLEDHLEQDLSIQDHEASDVQPAFRGPPHTSLPLQVQSAYAGPPRTTVRSSVQPAFKDEYSQKAHTAISKSRSSDKEQNIHLQPTPKDEGPVLPPNTGSDSSKAFTGSIVEHAHNIDSSPRVQAAASTSKPVSRFKMQRRQN